LLLYTNQIDPDQPRHPEQFAELEEPEDLGRPDLLAVASGVDAVGCHHDVVDWEARDDVNEQPAARIVDGNCPLETRSFRTVSRSMQLTGNPGMVVHDFSSFDSPVERQHIAAVELVISDCHPSEGELKTNRTNRLSVSDVFLRNSAYI
jgi:hypothetical protein